MELPMDFDKMKPTLSLKESECPQIKDWKVASKHTLTIEVEVISLGKDRWQEGKPLTATVEIRKVTTDKPIKDMTHEEYTTKLVTIPRR
jgi:hypothetical protein